MLMVRVGADVRWCCGGVVVLQVLVYHDMLGMTTHPHHEQVRKTGDRHAMLDHGKTMATHAYTHGLNDLSG